jgi:glycosyltransferase involved in cell wall biosynthesis
MAGAGAVPTRICVLTHRLGPVWEEGPFQRCFRWLLPEVVKRGVDVDLVAVGTAAALAWAPDRGPLRVFALGCDTWASAHSELSRYFAARRPVACVSVDSLLSVLALAAAAELGRPRPRIYPWQTTLTSAAAAKMPTPTRVKLQQALRCRYPDAARILGVSSDCVADLSSLGVRFARSGLLPNCVDQNYVTTVASGNGRDNRVLDCAHVVMGIGALSREKGYDVLVQAIASLDTDELDLGLVVLGDGAERARLTALADELGIGRRVILAGHRNDAWQWFDTASLFVHPARWEGFGMSLLEAMAYGLPVIATSCPGGPKEILERGRHGLLVEPENHHDLAAAVERMVREPDLRSDLGSRARVRAAAYAPTTVASVLLDMVCG